MDLLQRYPQLATGELHPQAAVGADHEGNVRVGMAVEDHLIRVLEHALIPIGRRGGEDHEVALAELQPAVRAIPRHPATGTDDSDVAHQLLDGRGNARGIIHELDELSPFLGMLREEDHDQA